MIDHRRRQLTPGTVWTARMSCHNAGHETRLEAHAKRIQKHLSRNPKDRIARGRQVMTPAGATPAD